MDQASILILAARYCVHTFFWTRYDYTSTTFDTHRLESILGTLKWKEQDPMTQVTSTFRPEPIDDIEAFYESSPLYRAR